MKSLCIETDLPISYMHMFIFLAILQMLWNENCWHHNHHICQTRQIWAHVHIASCSLPRYIGYSEALGLNSEKILYLNQLIRYHNKALFLKAALNLLTFVHHCNPRSKLDNVNSIVTDWPTKSGYILNVLVSYRVNYHLETKGQKKSNGW